MNTSQQRDGPTSDTPRANVAVIVEPPVVFPHDQRADSLALQVRVHRQWAEMDMRLVQVVLGPGQGPPAHLDRCPWAEPDQGREQSDTLRHGRLAGPNRCHAGHANQGVAPDRTDGLLGRQGAEQATKQSRVTAEPALGIRAVGGHVKRIVPHPTCQHADRRRHLVRSKIAHLDVVSHGPHPSIRRHQAGFRRDVKSSRRRSEVATRFDRHIRPNAPKDDRRRFSCRRSSVSPLGCPTSPFLSSLTYAWPEASEAWIERTTSAPSPTAAATRFVEPVRTSPIAKTPGRVHSSRSGPRSAPFQCREKSGWRLASSPVTTKPLSSWPTNWTSPSDLGEAPIIAKSAEVSTRRSGPAPEITTASSFSSPSSDRTSHPDQTRTFDLASIWSTR